MAKHPGSGDRMSGTISVGGDVSGSALSTGSENTLNVAYTSKEGPGDQARTLEALHEIRAAIEQLSGAYAKSAIASVDVAIKAASVDKPDKSVVGGALETALEAAKKSGEFASAAVKLLPLLKATVGWLGGPWKHLIDLVA